MKPRFHRRKVRCPNCGHVGKAKLRQKGSNILCLFLWLFILPGFFYTLWMLGAKDWICPKCENDKIYPFDGTQNAGAGAAPAVVQPVGIGATASGTKKCPFCAEVIQAEAIKCRFCGERLQ